MGLDRKSYSPLAQINKSNIRRLVPIWSTSLMNDSGELAAPVVYDGVIYAIINQSISRFTFMRRI
jgi:alcohol dehydrogenase (cytochrome c)